jgi:hypothetical protein
MQAVKVPMKSCMEEKFVSSSDANCIRNLNAFNLLSFTLLLAKMTYFETFSLS